MAGDLVLNTLYYSLASLGDKEKIFQNAALLGLAAGLGTVIFPKHLGLGAEPSARTGQTQLMTVAWYLAGGLAAAAASQALSRNFKSRE